MVTRRQLLASAGLAAVGGSGAAYALTTRPTEATGSSAKGTICRGPIQRSPDGPLDIFTVLVDEKTVTVKFELDNEERVATTAIVIDGTEETSQPWTGQRESLSFEHQGPVTFELQARTDDGTVIDSALFRAECVPADELGATRRSPTPSTE